jgi:ABC-type Fe3+ transport system permease subunit
MAALTRGGTVWRWVVLVVAGFYFLLPLWAALRFAGISAFGSVVGESGFGSSLGLSVRLAVVTTVITIALMLPTTVYAHPRLPGLRRLLEGITILPIVIPPVVLIVGVFAIAPGFIKSTSWLLALEYVVLAMPSSPGCCCSTSRCPPWTPRSGCSCASRSARCSSSSAPPPCSSPTTRKKPCPWRTGSAS